MGLFKKNGVLFRSQYDKGHSILGSVLGPPMLGNSHRTVSTNRVSLAV